MNEQRPSHEVQLIVKNGEMFIDNGKQVFPVVTVVGMNQKLDDGVYELKNCFPVSSTGFDNTNVSVRTFDPSDSHTTFNQSFSITRGQGNLGWWNGLSDPQLFDNTSAYEKRMKQLTARPDPLAPSYSVFPTDFKKFDF